MDKGKKKKKSDMKTVVYTPKHIKQKYEEYGFTYLPQEIFLVYVVAVALAIILGLLYKLSTIYLVILVAAGLLFVPIFLSAIPKSKYETVKLTEAAAYINQMIQSMNDCKMIYPALVQTEKVFDKESKMKKVLDKAIHHIEKAYDVQTAAVEALNMIETAYPCEQIRRLNDFCVRAQEIGTDFTKEMHLIGNFAQKWKKRQMVYYKELTSTRTKAIAEYVFLLFANVFMLRIVPENLTIIYEPIIQASSAILILSAYAYALYMQRKTCISLLTEKPHMTESQVDTAKNYIKNFKQSKTRKSAIRYGIICIVVTTITAFVLENVEIGVLGLIAGVVFLNMHNYILYATKKQIVTEVEEAFPKWLFDMCLYSQKSNISVAITESINTAPPILKKELEKMENELQLNPNSADAFLEFLKEYNMPNVKETMQTLLSLNIGSAVGRELQMQKLIDYNMALLDEQDDLQSRRKKAAMSIYHLLPMIPCVVVTLLYAVVLFMLSFENIFSAITW